MAGESISADEAGQLKTVPFGDIRRTRWPNQIQKRAWRTMTLALVVIMLWAQAAAAAPCEADDAGDRITGVEQCLLFRLFGPPDADALVVWLHGDVGSGGPADYHFAHAQRTVETFAAQQVASVALVRPGYPDGSGQASSVNLFHSGRRDHYTRTNLAEVAGAIRNLRTRLKPRTVVVVGHSGGAATAAVILGLAPDVVDAAVLVACPCDLVAWRRGASRSPWARSENPIRWVDQVPATARVVALTGSRDDNTRSALAVAYVEALRARGIEASFEEIAGAGHNDALRAPQVEGALGHLLGKLAAR
jgi:pimeloyl-ACP methyl ester carboxylesterase